MRPLRVAFLIPVFPELHNTFILNQITGLIDRGVDLDLYPQAVGSYATAHAEVAKYRLKERDRHIPVPEPRLQRVLGAVDEPAAELGMKAIKVLDVDQTLADLSAATGLHFA